MERPQDGGGGGGGGKRRKLSAGDTSLLAAPDVYGNRAAARKAAGNVPQLDQSEEGV